MKKINLIVSVLTLILILLNIDYEVFFSIKDFILIISSLLLVISSIKLNKSKSQL